MSRSLGIAGAGPDSGHSSGVKTRFPERSSSLLISKNWVHSDVVSGSEKSLTGLGRSKISRCEGAD